MAGTRALAVATGAFNLVASIIFTLSVTRRLPAEDLATLAVFNAALAVGLAFLGYATSWYSRILAKEPEKFGNLAAVGILMAAAALTIFSAYLLLYGRLDPVLVALGGLILLLQAWPAGAYLSVFKQRAATLAGFVGQLAKIAGAAAVRLNPTAYLALFVTAAVYIPTALAKVARPNFRGTVATMKTLIRGAPYQTLALLTTLTGGLVTYAVLLAGGDRLLSYSYVLFQLGKSVYPALTIVPLMYGSLLVERDKPRRALIDGAVLMYLYLLAAAVMAKEPAWYVALLRPSELGSNELIDAVRLNGIALLASGVFLHVDTTLKGVEERAIFTLRDKPAKALIFDLAFSPVSVGLMYVMASAYGAPGMVAASAITAAFPIAYRLRLLGRGYAQLVARLYLPAFAALAAVYLLPMPLLSYSTRSVLETVLTFIPNLLIIAAVSGTAFTLGSPPAREALKLLARLVK